MRKKYNTATYKLIKALRDAICNTSSAQECYDRFVMTAHSEVMKLLIHSKEFEINFKQEYDIRNKNSDNISNIIVKMTCFLKCEAKRMLRAIQVMQNLHTSIPLCKSILILKDVISSTNNAQECWSTFRKNVGMEVANLIDDTFAEIFIQKYNENKDMDDFTKTMISLWKEEVKKIKDHNKENTGAKYCSTAYGMMC